MSDRRRKISDWLDAHLEKASYWILAIVALFTMGMAAYNLATDYRPPQA